MAEAARQPVEFNNLKPEKNITDPNGVAVNPQLASAAYPRHLHKHVAEASDTSLVVAWKGKEPIHNEFVEVNSVEEQAAKEAEGFGLVPQLEPATEPAKKSKKSAE